MIAESLLTRIRRHPAAVELAPSLLAAAIECDDAATFLEQAVALARTAATAAFAAVVRQQAGRWETLASSGVAQRLDSQPLAEALDRDDAVVNGQWGAAPLQQRSPQGELLVLCCPPGSVARLADAADALAALLAAGLAGVRERQRLAARLRRLEAIVDIAAQWNQTLELEPLLERMAAAATRLLDSERASIFLWDRASRTLVGRPALGVEGGELRIPEDAGLVGRVVRTGEVQRVDRHQGQERIARDVDRRLGFETRTLLCAPLRGRDGQMFGAFEMINKQGGDFTADDEAALVELASHAAIALENSQQYELLLSARRLVADEAAAGVQLLGDSPAIAALRSTIGRVADTDLAILILGENGVGKEVVARSLHYLSRRRSEPLVAVNCAALTETLLESELFGHEKGAFTDARETRIGKFELASGGTLFLDEIGDMSLGGQAKLLRVLEEKVVVRVGGSTPIPTNTRVIAATNQHLGQLVREKKFREDLFYRLNVLTLDIPPLRERGDDIFLLAENFLREFCLRARRKPPKLTAAARKRLIEHTWPGNVRELRNLMERLAYLATGDKIDADELSFILAPRRGPGEIATLDLPLADATRAFQIEYIRRHIAAARGRMVDAARRLGLHRSNLYRKMRQLGMEDADGADADEPRHE